VERAAIGIDTERRRFLGVERAESAVCTSGLAELHALAHELDDVHAFFDEVEVTRHDYQVSPRSISQRGLGPRQVRTLGPSGVSSAE